LKDAFEKELIKFTVGVHVYETHNIVLLLQAKSDCSATIPIA